MIIKSFKIKSLFSHHQKSFTLIELLIVIAILALLMSIIIITLNPSEMLKKSRDTKRISSLKALNNALGIFQATKPTTSTGTAYIVYISIPDSSSTCANLSLPTLSDGYTYQCSTEANYRKTDGTGWIPVNFNSLDIGSPISSLPIDPTNTTSTNLFFTYTTGGSWELNAILESSANKLSGDNDKTSLDGGDSYSTYEIGTDLSLAPYKDTGLVGYWKFDEGTGTSAKDSSGYNNTGTLTNGPVWKTQSDCKRGGCLQFVKSNNTYVSISTANFGSNVGSISFWIKDTGSAFQTYPFTHTNNGNRLYMRFETNSTISLGLDESIPTVNYNPFNNTWTHYVVVYDAGTYYFYKDGSFFQSNIYANDGITLAATATISAGINTSIDGYIDEVRVYNRVLTASEVKAIYEGTK